MGKATLTALSQIQSELKAPKGQWNEFGKYNYRSCEDIMEAVKPLLKQYHAVMTVSDSVVLIGERYYVRSTVKFQSLDDDESVSVIALARECATKKGMDESQVTGSTSSYARKYALSGLFALDDQKDADAPTPRRRNRNATTLDVSPELQQARQEIVNFGKILFDKGVSRERVYQIIAENNGGKKRPQSIGTVEDCKKILAKLKELK